MHGSERREQIIRQIQESKAPVSGTKLASFYNVSRQVIVGDVALLRAAGAEISATPRGYVVQTPPAGLLRQVACRHDSTDMEAELNAMVDQGCTVLDVIVEHPVYGQLTGLLQLSSRYEIQQFLSRCSRSDARPLSDLTGGIHLLPRRGSLPAGAGGPGTAGYPGENLIEKRIDKPLLCVYSLVYRCQDTCIPFLLQVKQVSPWKNSKPFSSVKTSSSPPSGTASTPWAPWPRDCSARC